MARQVLVAVVLIYGEKQSENLSAILDACASLDGVIIVSGESIPGAVAPSQIPGFNAGANRDLGIAEARRRFPGCSIVLLDGDCLPGPTWATEHRAACVSLLPTVACGSRTEGGTPDPRTSDLVWQGREYPPSFVPSGRGSVPLQEIMAHRATWACNISINALALDLLLDAGLRIHGVPRIFSPIFDGLWGGEDTGFGVLSHHAGCAVVTLDPGRSAVEHVPHESRIRSVRNLRLVEAYEEQVRCFFVGGNNNA